MSDVLLNQMEMENERLTQVIDEIKDIKIDDDAIKTQQKLSQMLKKLGYEVKCNFPANDRGDGKKGKISIMVYGLDKPIGICIDNKHCRKKSITKLNSIPSIYRIIIFRNGIIKYLKEGITAIISLDIKGHDRKMGIYKITNLMNNRIYIGSSVDLIKRINDHKTKLNNNIHTNKGFQNDWNKYGEDNFSFEIVKIIDSEIKLPHEEKALIEYHKPNVYNISDPMEETHRGRFKVEKVKSEGTCKYSRQQAIDYLNENFSDKMKILHEHIGERIFFSKEQLDKWFLDNIKDHDLVSDRNIEQFLKKWYNKNGFTVLEARIWKSVFKKVYNKDIGKYKYILVTPETSIKLYETKYRN